MMRLPPKKMRQGLLVLYGNQYLVRNKALDLAL
jgi:hypothetical protein